MATVAIAGGTVFVIGSSTFLPDSPVEAQTSISLPVRTTIPLSSPTKNDLSTPPVSTYLRQSVSTLEVIKTSTIISVPNSEIPSASVSTVLISTTISQPSNSKSAPSPSSLQTTDYHNRVNIPLIITFSIGFTLLCGLLLFLG